jgi:hypothetical protein
MKTLDQLIEERDELRAAYKRTSGSDQKIILMRGKLLTWAIEKREKEPFVADVIEALF